MIDIIDTLEKFDALKDEWERIEQNPDMRIFQTYSWCRNAWDICVSKEKGARLWILRWHQDGKDDVVIFPFYIDGKGCLRFIMDRHSDVCNAVYEQKDINRYWTYRDLADLILEEKAIKSVWFQKMRCDCEILDYLGAILKGAVVYRDNAYAYMKIYQGGDIKCSQEHMRSSDRKHWRQLLRKSEKYEFAVFAKSNGDLFPEEDIRRLTNEMVSSGSRGADFFTEETTMLMKAMYENGQCEIPVLKENNKVITLEFRLLKNNYTLDWVFLSTNPNTGTEINVKYCTESAKSRTGIMDFGVGAYEYKILTTRPMLGVNMSLRFGKTAWEQIKCAIGMNLRFAKDYIKMRLKKH